VIYNAVIADHGTTINSMAVTKKEIKNHYVRLSLIDWQIPKIKFCFHEWMAEVPRGHRHSIVVRKETFRTDYFYKNGNVMIRELGHLCQTQNLLSKVNTFKC